MGPGHMGIEGNDRANELAKEATELEPATETTTIAKLHRQLRAKMKTEWTIEWARKPISGRYAISDRIPSSLAGSHAFRTLDGRTLGIVTQARTGHGYFGEYYQTHNIQEPADCPCGAGLQTREHIVFECRTHGEYGVEVLPSPCPSARACQPDKIHLACSIRLETQLHITD